jgi:DNA invertase Pin-like site-specific DNA recombinase
MAELNTPRVASAPVTASGTSVRSCTSGDDDPTQERAAPVTKRVIQALIAVALYIRVSTRRQAEDGESLAMQEQMGHDYAAAHGMRVVEVYVDTVTGRFLERPDLLRMIRERDRFEAVLVYKRDRLSRSRDNVAVINHQLRRPIISMTEPNGERPEEKLTNTILDAMSEFSTALTADRVRDTNNELARRGEWHGGTPPTGYDCVDRRLVLNDDAPFVKAIYDTFLNVRTLRSVAKTFNGKFGDGTGIRKMIANPVYAGLITHRGIVYQGIHEPIIDMETLVRATDVLAENLGKPNKGSGRKAAGRQLCEGDMIVGPCGHAMWPRTDRTSQQYRCSARVQLGRDACTTRPVNCSVIDEALIRGLPVDWENVAGAILGDVAARVADTDAMIITARKDILRARGALERITADYRAGDITGAQWSSLEPGLVDDVAAAQSELDALLFHRVTIAEDMTALDARAEIWGRLTTRMAAVSGHIDNPGAIAEARAAIKATFGSIRWDGAHLHPELRPDVVLSASALTMRPGVRPGTAGRTSRSPRTPVLRRRRRRSGCAALRR